MCYLKGYKIEAGLQQLLCLKFLVALYMRVKLLVDKGRATDIIHLHYAQHLTLFCMTSLSVNQRDMDCPLGR